MSHVANPTGVVTGEIHTPNVTLSKTVGIIVIIFLLLVALIGYTIWYLNSSKNHTYDLSTMQYGEVKNCIVEKGHYAVIKFTRDYFPYHSSGILQVVDDHGRQSTLEGSTFTRGDSIMVNSFEATYFNNTNKDITLEVARCKSKQDCNITF